MKHYYTAGEARQFLDMDVGAFYYLIETGKIKRITPPGKKRGFYSKHQIERLADQKLKHMNVEEEAGPIFMKATWDDLDCYHRIFVMTACQFNYLRKCCRCN